MKLKNRLKRNLVYLKKNRGDVCFEMDLSYREIKWKLKNGFEAERRFNQVVKKVKLKKKFKKKLAKDLGMKYSLLKDHFPLDLNSTMIANFLDPYLLDQSHEDVRNASQKLKLEFEEVYKVMI